MNIEKVMESRSERDTEDFACELAKSLPCGSVIALDGNLGAGKTVFARGFARGLGITEPLSSPTYTIIQEYELAGGGRLYHMDLYRIANPAAALAFGVDEFLNDPKSYVLVEWPERIASLLPPQTRTVKIEHRSETTRQITLTK